jgi:hypothetical protein
MDHRLAFLWETAASPEKTETIPDEVKLPVQCSFTHRAPNAEGEVELQYWPAREGCGVPPEQLTVFILGECSCVRRRYLVAQRRRLVKCRTTATAPSSTPLV